MEKFRHFGDAATGIHPFTVVVAPTTLGRIGATCMFPMRLLFSTVFVLLLLLTDTLLWVLYRVYLGILGQLLLAPLQRASIRGLLFFIGHILPDQPTVITQLSSSNAKKGVVTSRQVRAGDVVVCNLQSVWDGPVLEVMLAQPYHALCFPDATATAGPAPGLRVFWPSPLQRWKVWGFVRRTGTLDFLTAQQTLAKKDEALPLYRVQDAAATAGVPVWWCGEGTCSNGKGLLPMPAAICRSCAPTPTTAQCSVYVATIQYDSPALQNVLGSDVEDVFSFLFRTSVLLYGSTAPAWSSPFFPSAEVTFGAAGLTRATAYEAEGAHANAKSSSAATYWTLNPSAVLELRHAMCQRGQALVVSGGGSGGAAVRRQPLSVGVKEKKGFVEAYVAMLLPKDVK
ncbi:hypothetical protein ABB37_06918 [Leptomonas pyrrhocoris]|uniref:Uncharacterized protein n=1 Tax=Leptomonas pyrrhocoris TaxID=157538 RepID=A0A0M9FWJ1_LEPPY|nr:hypothetical protein ABB37_06918 [Leptomonas pyrrhocoris]XP_015655979.1 hypothetical protein ABB37_06918 [Leptomonas pyrrhocoris]XP_015655980.1 hypothetical protein ABB37_06918 [Leptomonas pyrrhocoris]KPA77539.1 hypothetical protein ABB37_06918 [Leptomonas pyrrhocoris]KPA77540.1 hypothetical protein ABB37_06918 [Leptomonas pyrrhocoris]KPA77541.1 hypothetical protein ABB37_06918 [Leptomonas pyrrhocoris]|eukprot:XP_015655978.1 hypothetical protein ABB37_06918 [Leptomonas pyrrhocoris]